ncbi:MAG TPA: hypothetical protein VGC20_05415 [bacterium]
MHDAIELESLGLPAAVVVTTVFAHEARVQREALGMPGLAPVVITHPLSTLADEAIRARALEAAPQAVRIWLGRDAR